MALLVEKGKTRCCGFCNKPVDCIRDDSEERIYKCFGCDAVETISKSKTSWWYHGWRRSNGEKLRAATSGEMTRGIYGWQPDNS